MGQVLDL